MQSKSFDLHNTSSLSLKIWVCIEAFHKIWYIIGISGLAMLILNPHLYMQMHSFSGAIIISSKRENSVENFLK
jgi:hypothetical protein